MRIGVKRSIAIAVLLVWGGLGLWIVGKNDAFTRSEAIEAVNRELVNPGLVWAREDMHLNSLEMWRRPCPTCPPGRLLGGETGLPVWENPERVRILTIGDSFAVGAGLFDANARWGARLEQTLSKRHGDGNIEVVSIGESAVSAFAYTAWLEAIARGDYSWFTNDETGVLRGKFDAIVIGHIGNDVVHSPGDAYLRLPDLQIIPWDRQEGIIGRDETNPNWEAYTMLPSRMAAAGGGAAMLVVPIYSNGVDEAFGDPRIRPLYEAAGFDVVHMVLGAEWVKRAGPERSRVNPADLHPGHGFYAAASMDMADAVEKAIGPTRIARAKARGGEVRRPLIASHLSIGLKVEHNTSGADVAWNGNAWTPAPDICFSATGRSEGSYLECNVYRYQGSRIPAQHLPCATLGRPHMVLAFASDREGTATIEHLDGGGIVLEVYGYRYGEIDVEIEPVAQLAAGETGTVEVRGEVGFDGIFVAEAGKTTCEYDDDAGGMIGAFQMRISEPKK